LTAVDFGSRLSASGKTRAAEGVRSFFPERRPGYQQMPAVGNLESV
jgi:hypothetical protein